MTDPQNQSTARIRILVGIDARGVWMAKGDSGATDEIVRGWVSQGNYGPWVSYHWIEADVPLPVDRMVIEGAVTND